MSTVTTSRSVRSTAAAVGAQALRQATRQEAAERLALLLTIDDRLLEQAEAAQRALLAGAGTAWRGARNSASMASLTASGVVRRAAAIALTGLPSATCWSRSSSSGVSAPSARTGDTSACTICGSSIEPPVATSRMARARRSPSDTRSFSR